MLPKEGPALSENNKVQQQIITLSILYIYSVNIVPILIYYMRLLFQLYTHTHIYIYIDDHAQLVYFWGVQIIVV